MRRIILLLIILAAFLTSCQKFEESVETPATNTEDILSMENLIISDNFNWNATKTLNVQVVLPKDEEVKPIRIVSTDRKRIYFQGYPEDNSGIVNTKVTVPSYVKEAEIQIQHGSIYEPVIVSVGNESVYFDFNSSYKSSIYFKTSSSCEVLDFSEDGHGNPLLAGTVLSNQWANKGISVSAHNNNNSHPDKAIIFDSSNPTGGDFDLGTPNQDFGGPGVGNGGKLGQPGQNDQSLGNLVIIATNDTDSNGDNLVDVPNDEAAGGKIFFDFDDPVEIEKIEFVDMDDGTLSSKVKCKQEDGTIVQFTIPNLGENSYKNLSVFVSNVVKLTIEYKGSGGFASIAYCYDPPVEEIGGNLSYEDLWPGKGDYDFNDVVIDYDFNIIKNSLEQIEQIEATFITRAFGASYHNGFGFTFPNVSPDQIKSVSGYDIQSGSIFSLNPNGTEAGQSKATFIVFDDTYNIMQHPGQGIGVNTEKSAPYVTPDTIVMNIIFYDNGSFAPGGPVTYSQLDIGNFNPFIVVDQIRDKEVHLPDREPTDLASNSYFGTFDDDSDPLSGRYYKTSNNLPWAIHIPEPFDYPVEKQLILGAYLHFAEWAQSNGSLYADWYKDLPGYRNASVIY